LFVLLKEWQHMLGNPFGGDQIDLGFKQLLKIQLHLYELKTDALRIVEIHKYIDIAVRICCAANVRPEQLGTQHRPCTEEHIQLLQFLFVQQHEAKVRLSSK
jgi:hypothetical protein